MLRSIAKLRRHALILFCTTGLAIIAQAADLKAQSANPSESEAEVVGNTLAVYTPEAKEPSGVRSLVDARRPYQDLGYQIQDRIRSLRISLRHKEREVKLLDRQMSSVAQDSVNDGSTVLRMQERIKAVEAERFDMLLQKEELISQFSEINHELRNLTRQIRELRNELKSQKRS